jgi:short-subunit dehydrogenase
MKIFITGGTSGIGLALAEYYLTHGHQVGLCGRDLSKLPSKIRNSAKCYQADVLDSNTLRMAIEEFAEAQIDLLIANAGISLGGAKFTNPDFPRSKKVLEVNILGVVNSFEAAFPIMKKQGRGHLAAISSVAGFVGLPGAGPYSASKAAVTNLLEAYAIDFKHFNIDVSCICPGFIKTPLTDKNTHPMPFLMGSDDAAKRIAKALANKKALFVFPKRMAVLITIAKYMPRWIYRLMMSRSPLKESE